MSIELRIAQTGAIKRELSLQTLCGQSRCYGRMNGFRLVEGELGEHGFVLYNPARIGRGINVTWRQGERDSIALRLSSPAGPEEIDDLCDIAVRVSEVWADCQITLDGKTLSALGLSRERPDMKRYNAQVLQRDLNMLETGTYTIQCAFWPLVLGVREREILSQPDGLRALGEYLHRQQALDVYYAMPGFWRKNGKIIGAYTYTEDTPSIFPNVPYVPYGVKDPAAGGPLHVDQWVVNLFSISRDAVLGQIAYVDFQRMAGEVQYYDDRHSIVEGLPLDRLDAAIREFGAPPAQA